ncbi:glycosyltransferase family 4 protein [Sphingomonas sp. IW22]|uniref:glycosyltransferase family 4 protein n=1 Tax=Sphingomonas sp. IW22 TaxID=3242489 RepID=UPI0035204B65
MNDARTVPALKRIALIGTCVPRHCGIATFTDDMQRALTSHDPNLSCITVAVTDSGGSYAYPDFVPLEIDHSDPASFAVAADFLNVADIEVVSLQHEFGIFGGEAGENVLELLRGLKTPVVTTLHTILAAPNPAQRQVMDEIIGRSARLVAMADKGRQILEDVYGVPSERISVIPHGVPDRPFLDPAMAQHDLGLADRTVLMTFGLLGPGKGIETAIGAMPALVRDHPKILYMIVGATHPSLRRHEGERYRASLVALADELGVTDHIHFVDRYLSLDELLDHLAACDIYLSPYPNEAQIVSGTLAYAVALGKAVVSTPFWYAQELLADNCGVLVPFGAPNALAGAVSQLIDDDTSRSAIRTQAYALGRMMTWSNVARQYLEVFSDVRLERRSPKAEVIPFAPGGARRNELPPLATVHLDALTDNVGLIQHTQFAVPDRRHGYCLDDNARALLLMAEIARLRPLSSQEDRLALTYAAFVEHAWCPAESRVHNFMGFDREWLDEPGADDAHGRAVWALGAVARHQDPRRLDSWAAARLLDFAPPLNDTSSPRAWAYGLLGIEGFLGRFPGHRGFERLRDNLADRLFQRWSDAAAPDWNWFEDRLGYDNAKLCEALLVTGHARSNSRHIQVGLDTLRWLMKLQTAEAGHFRPIGTDTFGTDRRHPEPFDQQPLEACSAVSACLIAANVSGDHRWRQEARRAFSWFLGENDLRIPVADAAAGACFDGLHPDRRNANQGAESTLAYLAALTAMLLANDHQFVTPLKPAAVDAGHAISARQDSGASVLPGTMVAKAI